MATIAQQRCFNHARREAAARCPQCERYFCRECVTEHEDRVLCSSCLAQRVGGGAGAKSRGSWLVSAFQAAAAFLIVWFVFYGMGYSLLRLPDDFHEGRFWNEPWAYDE